MNDSATVASWIQVGIGFIAMVLFIIVERKNLFPVKPTKPSGSSRNKQAKEIPVSPQPIEDSEKEDVDIRAGIYSRILVGIIFGITIGNIYLRISSYFQHNFSRNEIVISVVAIPVSLIISFIFDYSTSSTKSFFVHWAERFVIVCGYLYIFSTYVICYNVVGDNPRTQCEFFLWERALLVTAIFMILISYPSTPIDWLMKSIKSMKIESIKIQ